MNISLRKHFLWLAVPVVLVLGLLLWFPVSASAQVTVFSDTFDAEFHGATTTLTNWTVTGNNVDVLGSIPTPNVDFYPGNGNYLDMEGTPAGNATIVSAPLSLNPGTYQLSFEMGQNGNPAPNDNGLSVTLGTVFTGTFVAPPPGTGTLTPITVTIVVFTPTTASLVFSETGTANLAGSILDDVLLTLQDTKVTICHKGKNTISIGPKAAAKHIEKHSDTLGACPPYP